MKKFIPFFALFIMSIIFLTSCSNAVYDVPAGYVGKKLTPTGWDSHVLEAGQIDLGTTNSNGTSTSLVLLESTTSTVKEQFMGKEESQDKQDHRCRTKDGSPLIVDIYVQVATPADEKSRDAIFAMVTPSATKSDRVSLITLNDIYEKFVKQNIRGSVRAIFAQYENADSVMHNWNKINAQVGETVLDIVKQTHAPFQIVSTQLSNVKEDDAVLAAKNQQLAAKDQIQTIKDIGEALRQNPQYLEKQRLDMLEKVGASDKATVIIMDSKGSGSAPVMVNTK